MSRLKLSEEAKEGQAICNRRMKLERWLCTELVKKEFPTSYRLIKEAAYKKFPAVRRPGHQLGVPRD